ncbi:1-aminocyclopropane-1-carboxylate oxidase homolog 1-like [Mangifera indica]|uniref:1-aminocyclopropane-1-carboxylate oxidase homolog 1-like n=1 Tax=Mangifera indica TaxID=29780 RepID=UPI001CF9921D|nr:1-aminocyclopropane-1-carboxylate oxidase homolog 1-like [Mangifera indica]
MALALKPEHLKEMGCTEGFSIACHYYASCPQAELTLGATKHSDPSFMTKSIVANGFVPRIFVACFFTGHATGTPKLYGPIKELTSEEKPPVYRDFLIYEYLNSYFARKVGDKSQLYQFKL